MICKDENARATARFRVNASLLPVESRRRILRKKLASPITVAFQELPLEDCVTYIGECSRLPILLSRGRNNAGIRRDAPVNMQGNKDSLTKALNELLGPLNLDWHVVDPDVIVVMSQAAAARRLEPRVYRTKELLAAGQTEKGLMAQIAAIEPDSWAARGGPGQMRPLPGVLIVCHNRRVHEQIAEILATPR
jgi:hypothetical protein